MTEGGTTRTKRTGARFFKNPPQPHMCIQDFLRGSNHPCYINVLSWDKIGKATSPFERLPLHGGMRINPPRTEIAPVTVFFVLANPEILKTHGKNASDPKEQSLLIELLLDFIEAMNEGIVFTRQYKILNDRDITGELKEVWMVVQADRAKAQNESGSEEVKKPVPQYPQYQDQASEPQKQQQQHQQNQQSPPQQQQQQQQQQQKFQPQQHQQPQQYRQPHQHQAQQLQTQQQLQKQNDEHQQHQPSQPPQYHSNSPIPRDIYRWMNSQPPLQQQMYPAPQYQYQQLPRQVGPYNSPNIHPSANLGCPTMPNPGIPPVNTSTVNPGPQIHYDHYLPMHENNVYVKLHRMQQPQQPQIKLVHALPDPGQAPTYLSRRADSRVNMIRMYGPPANDSQSNIINKRQSSPTHSNSPVKETSKKSKRPAIVIETLRALSERVSGNPPLLNNTVRDVTIEKKHIQVTDLDEDEPKNNLNSHSDLSIDSKKSENIYQKKSVENKKDNSVFVDKVEGFHRNELSSVGSHNNNLNNGKKSEAEQQQDCEKNKKILDRKSVEKQLSNCIPESMKNGCIDVQRVDDDSQVVTSYANTLKKNITVIGPSTSDQTTITVENDKINGQQKNFGKDNAESFQVYTILRKPETSLSQEQLADKIAQMSVKECTDPSDFVAVPS